MTMFSARVALAPRPVPGDMTTTAGPGFPSSLPLLGDEAREDLRRSRCGKTDGRMLPVTPADLVRGNVLCHLDHEGGTSAFSDCVVVDVYETNGTGDRITPLDAERGAKPVYRMVRLARPYVYVSSAETACPTVLQGFEDYVVLADSLTDQDSRFRVRCQSTGKVDRRVT